MLTRALACGAVWAACLAPAWGQQTVRVDYQVTSEWGSGFQGQLTVANHATYTIDAWRLEFQFPANISSLWGGRVSSHVGAHYALIGPDWDDGALAPGETATMGFTAAGGVETPTGVTLNGAPVTLGVESPAPAPPAPIPAPAWPAGVGAAYVDATAWPPLNLSGEMAAGTLRFFNLGFVVAVHGTATPAWGGYAEYSVASGYLLSTVNAVRAAGGDVMVSFGGAANTELAVACATPEQAAAAYQSVIDAYGLTHIDFDIEGAWLADPVSVDRRNRAVALLQGAALAAGRPLKVWYTLPVLPTGLTADGVALLDNALLRGVRIDGLNVMAMDYGDSSAPDPAGRMGQYAVAAGDAAAAQLQAAFARAGQPSGGGGPWARIGVTPMIGRNDVITEVFTLADAAQVVETAHQRGGAMVAFWSLNRDVACPPGTGQSASPTCSGVAQSPRAFAQVFGAYTGTLCAADVGVQGGTAGSDGQLDNNDFVVFIGWFFAPDTRADIGRQGGMSGGDGAWDNNDFVVYIERFFSACW